MNNKRKLQLAVLSDLHLGTYGCHAKEISNYLDSIEPETLILNGDIVDIWQFSKRYWPKAHHKVLSQIMKMMDNGCKVYYITGNHDEMLRRFTDFEMGNLTLCNKLILDLDGTKTWFFHGDVFDVSMHSKLLAKLGGKGYDILILLNRFVNWFLNKIGREKISLSKKVKESVKQAIKFVSDYEKTAIEMAVYHGFDAVVCGHIHQPKMEKRFHENKEITYLNSGDWVENCTALEYNNKEWKLYSYFEENKGETHVHSPEAFSISDSFELEMAALFSIEVLKKKVASSK